MASDANSSQSRRPKRLNESIGEPISRELFERWVKTYQDWAKRFRKDPFRAPRFDPGVKLAQFFGAKTYLRILSQRGCIGIATYSGLDEDGVLHFILVGVGSNGKPQLPAYGENSSIPSEEGGSLAFRIEARSTEAAGERGFEVDNRSHPFPP